MNNADDEPKILIGKLEFRAALWLSAAYCSIKMASISHENGDTPESVRKEIDLKIDEITEMTFNRERA